MMRALFGGQMIIFPGKLQASAVIFDFDGVIVDTEPLHYKAFQLLLEPLGLGYSWQQYLETYMGFDDRDAFIEAFSANGRRLESSELHALIDQKAHIFQDVIRSGITSYSGVVDLIRKFHRTRVPLAICSGALRSDIIPILDMLDIADCFAIIVTAEDVVKSKPDPECYQLTYEKLCTQYPQTAICKADTLVIEDTPAGIEAAQKAGMQVIAVANSYPHETITHASYVVDSLEELVNFHIK
jgi:beta-phosphoglucomutase